MLEAAVPLIHSLTLFCRSMMWALGDVSTEPAASLLQSYVPQQGTSDRTVTVKHLKAGDKEGRGSPPASPSECPWDSHHRMLQGQAPARMELGPWAGGNTPAWLQTLILPTTPCISLFHRILTPVLLLFVPGNQALHSAREAEPEEGKSRSCLAIMLPLSSGTLP